MPQVTPQGELELTPEEWAEKTFDDEAEQCVLGAALMEPAAAEIVLGAIRPKHFWRAVHRTIFETMLAIRKRGAPVEVVTLTGELRSNGKLQEVGGPQYLLALFDAIPTTRHVRAYMASLLRRYEWRETVAAGKEMATGLLDFDKAYRRLQAVAEERALLGAVQHVENMPDAHEAVEAYIRSFCAEDHRPHFDVEDLDCATGGLPTPGFVVVKGASSFGKTALALQALLDWTNVHREHGLLFSLEMRMREQVVPRLVSVCSGVELTPHAIRTGDEEELVERALNAVNRIICSNLSYHDAAVNIDGLCGRTRESCTERGTRLVVVDYLQLLDTDGGFGQRWERIRQISLRLKRLSLETGACIMALSQVRGEDYHSEGARGIDDDADMSIRVERDGATIDERKASTTGKLVVEKNRNGPTGEHPVIFRNVRFWSPDQYRRAQEEEAVSEQDARYMG